MISVFFNVFHYKGYMVFSSFMKGCFLALWKWFLNEIYDFKVNIASSLFDAYMSDFVLVLRVLHGLLWYLYDESMMLYMSWLFRLYVLCMCDDKLYEHSAWVKTGFAWQRTIGHKCIWNIMIYISNHVNWNERGYAWINGYKGIEMYGYIVYGSMKVITAWICMGYILCVLHYVICKGKWTCM